MPLPTPPPTLLRDAALFLDFDGTLVPIADRPDAITIAPGLLPLLERLQAALAGRLTLVSGRAAADVRRWIAPLEVAVAGSHGLELGTKTAPRSAALEEGLRHLRGLQAEHAGVLLEEKPLGAALHYREAPGAEDACRAAVTRVALSTGMEVQPGKMVFEIKPADGDKGTAIQTLMQRPDHAGHRPVFIGDDLTDEHGFAVVRDLGGSGILVGEERDTAATHRLRDVAEVHRWLNDACEEMS
ncbi:trehalose 6-phosphate phosphatase [Sphingomonas kaistensis]|uniref:Trehalose 6-phosphate phosphatase n=1 Tax=Sphingomonas kaistensis TaxID=298708 RepID=A0A7X5Y4Z8_9SPHN|nr:trehalose-phosphatase [Sphingomonas kaistensis]NJC04652.1 trehalose 6-phosphate phosphatase [Sphingomonas kaistensis]